MNTMSQNHTTSNGIPGWDQIDNPALNTVGKYHGNAPRYWRVYATLPHKNCVYANPECICGFPSQK